MNWVMIVPMIVIGFLDVVLLVAFIYSCKDKDEYPMIRFALFMAFIMFAILEYIIIQIGENIELP